MRRRFSTRDLGLSIRIVLALVVVGLMYVLLEFLLLVALVGAAREKNVIVTPGLAMLLVAVPSLLRQQYRKSGGLTLRAVDARADARGHDLEPVAAKLAALADVAAPSVRVARSRAANALAVATPGGNVIVVTTALLELLEPREVEAVVAHELTHLANGDGKVMTFVGGPALGGAALWHDSDFRAKLGVVMFYWPFWLLGLLLMRAMSRYREYTADRGSALLTGAPEQLMSALTKIGGETPRGDLRGGAAVSALCVVPTRRRWWLLADHPPLRKRLARLERMAREQGRAVGP